jgi:putative tryptophan/tyrosine transport system substrate-binding protein
MIRRRPLVTAGAAALAALRLAQAQPAGRPVRIGYLGSTPPDTPEVRAFYDAFRSELARLGWPEGSRVAYEWRYAEGVLERFAPLARELVALKPNLILAASSAAVDELTAATSMIPIVFITPNPVEEGQIASLARPGGNLTGLAFLSSELIGKRMQLLKEAFPRVARVAYLAFEHPRVTRETHDAARTLQLELLPTPFTDRAEELQRAIAAVSQADAWFVGAVACTALAARAQRRHRPPRVAIVISDIPAAELAGAEPASPYLRTFVHALRDLGLVDGRDIVIERRSAEGRLERLDALMRKLVALELDVIVADGPGVVAAQRATDRIAIVGLVENPLDHGLIQSLARPGRNLTGFGGNFEGLEDKQLQLLKEAVPTISRVAVIAHRARPGPRARWRAELDDAAGSMQLGLRWLAVDTPEEFEPAFATIVQERSDALFFANTAINFGSLRRIADFAARQRLPSLCSVREFAAAGGRLSYGYGLLDDYRQAARYVKRILDGAKPADLPFEQPTKIELVINLKTARALGLTIPQSILLRADEVIE